MATVALLLALATSTTAQWSATLPLALSLAASPAPSLAPLTLINDTASLSGQAVGWVDGTAVANEAVAPFDFSATLGSLEGWPATEPPQGETVYVWARTRSAAGDSDDDALYLGLTTPDRVFGFPSPGAGVYGWNRVEVAHGGEDYGHDGVTASTTFILHRGEPGAVVDAVFLSTNETEVPPSSLPTTTTTVAETTTTVGAGGGTSSTVPGPVPSSTGAPGSAETDASTDGEDGLDLGLALGVGISVCLVCLVLCVGGGYVLGSRPPRGARATHHSSSQLKSRRASTKMQHGTDYY
jgi:hypothetical protein